MPDTIPTPKDPSLGYTLSLSQDTAPEYHRGLSSLSNVLEIPSTSSKPQAALGLQAGSLSQSIDTLCSATPAAQCGPGFNLPGAL